MSGESLRLVEDSLSDGAKFFRGVFWALVFSAPFWMVVWYLGHKT